MIRARNESVNDLGAIELCATGGIKAKVGAAKVFASVERSGASCCRCGRTYSEVPLWYTVACNRRRSKAVNGGRGRVACRRVELQFGCDGLS